MERVREESREVLYCEDEVVRLDAADVERLERQAGENPRPRVRVCAHRSVRDPLHEMVIVLGRDSYVRPHRHLGRSESFHVVAGRAQVLLFDDRGAPQACIEMGDYRSGRAFFYRIDRPIFHSLIVQSDRLVFHETTSGPFDPRGTEAAGWAPADGDAAAGQSFLRRAALTLEKLG